MTSRQKPLMKASVRDRRFPNVETPIIKDLELDLFPGEIVGVLGPSGIGKTSLLRALALLDEFIGNVSIENRPKSVPSREIQIVFQDVQLLPWLTVGQNLTLPAVKPEQATKKAMALLEALGLPGFFSRWPLELSGGEKQRVGIARSFVVPPRVLLLDEPYKSLDVSSRWMVDELLIDFVDSDKGSVVFVSHDLETAVRLCDRIFRVDGSPMSIHDEYQFSSSRPRDPASSEAAAVRGSVYDAIKSARRVGAPSKVSASS